MVSNSNIRCRFNSCWRIQTKIEKATIKEPTKTILIKQNYPFMK